MVENRSEEMCTYCCGKAIGGVESVVVVEASQIEKVSSNGREEYDGITLKKGASFEEIILNEGSARYSESIKRIEGNLYVTHTLEFVLEKMDDYSRRVLKRLADDSKSGIAAVIYTAAGEALLAGYSEAFCSGKALRLAAAEGTTGMERNDPRGEKVTLASCDTEKARRFTGKINA